MKRLIYLLVLGVLAIALPALSHTAGTAGGGPVMFGDVQGWLAEVEFPDTTAAAKVQLNPMYGQPWAYWTSEGYPAVSIALDDYVDYGDGSTIAPDGDGAGIHAGLNDPEFEVVGSLTTTFMVECVVVAAGTFKDRITAASTVDPIHQFGAWGDYGTTNAIPTTHINIGCGVGLEWTAAGGHTVGDTWYIVNYADDEYLGATAGQISATRADLDGDVDVPVVFLYEPWDLTY